MGLKFCCEVNKVFAIWQNFGPKQIKNTADDKRNVTETLKVVNERKENIVE